MTTEKQQTAKPEAKPRPSRRGFAGMDPERHRELARAGGRAAHARGVAYEFTAEKAQEAGKKGGTTVSQDRSHMAQIGRKGGEMRGENIRKRATAAPAPE